MNVLGLAHKLTLAIGALDLCIGCALLVAPSVVLPMVGLVVPANGALVYLRFVGAYVAALGASYLLTGFSPDAERLKSSFAFSLPFRLFIGAFCGVAIVCEWLPAIWAVVAGTNLALAAGQIWLLARAFGP